MRKPEYSYNDATNSAIVSFAEACAANNLPSNQILRLLNYYIPNKAPLSISSNHSDKTRNTYFRAVALKLVISNKIDFAFDDLIPSEQLEDNKTYKNKQRNDELKRVIGGLLPWYIARARALINNEELIEFSESAESQARSFLTQGWRDYDVLLYEVSRVQIDILIFCNKEEDSRIEEYYSRYLKSSEYIWMQDSLVLVRAAFRVEHLIRLRRDLERSIFELIQTNNDGPDQKSELYVDLARSIFCQSKDDAATYFDYAIQAVSKFGDEIVERWESIVSLAKRGSESLQVSPDISYRFIRTAELVGDNVAREKYWNRNDAIRTLVRMSPSSALAALSRWRDRDIGWFDQQLFALTKELVVSKDISPMVAWSLSAFFNQEYELNEIAIHCIRNESSATNRQFILTKAVEYLSLNETSELRWKELNDTANQYSVDDKRIREILNFYTKSSDKKVDQRNQAASYKVREEKQETFKWEEIFLNLELTSHVGISSAFQHFEKVAEIPMNHEGFWMELYRRINDNEVIHFLNELVIAERVDLFDIRTALQCIPKDWKTKASVIQKWPGILKKVAQRFASELSERGSLEYFLGGLQVEVEMIASINAGIIEGLSNNSELVSESTFFGFVKIASSFVSEQEAIYLMDFALARIEMHIDEDYADGKWSKLIVPPTELSESFAGFIWAALGSPQSKLRWQAAHCVARLAEGNCIKELEDLIKWMKKDSVDSFGSSHFVFYNLHARLYLLIALARISVENAQILQPYHEVFAYYALEFKHIIIQKYAADIAINIENVCSNTYSKDILRQLKTVGISQLPAKVINRSERFIGYDYDTEEGTTGVEFHHGIDIDSYWYDPLGKVFGISGKKIAQRASEIILKEWDVKLKDGYLGDPRSALWRSHRDGRNTYHSHGSYPKSDDLRFYYSYHAMFVVASELLDKMPVLINDEWYEDEWDKWFKRHLLSRKNGYWLADRRDALPLSQYELATTVKSTEWVSEISAQDFIEQILIERNGEYWLNVAGLISKGDSNSEETVYISTALVSPDASQSLLNALSTCPNPHDFKLPNYNEEDMEMELNPFFLKGWVWQEESSKRLDDSDPHAAQILYPPYLIGESIAKIMGLSTDKDQREWFSNGQKDPDLICEMWSTANGDEDKEPLKRGELLFASISFLKQLCVLTECELIFEVQIKRELKYKSYSGMMMQMDIEHLRTKSIYSHPMEDLETQKRIINLGKKLVKELNLDPGVNTLARWMAHYIAEQMEFAQNAVGEIKDEAEKRCFESILKLWEQHSDLPDGIKPFQNFDSIFRAIERLDPDNDEFYFFLNSRRKEGKDELIGDVQRWLQMAEDIDQVARVWLEYVFKQAALSAVDDNTEEWLELSEGFSQAGDASFWSHYFYEEKSETEEAKRELLLSRIEKLEAFNEINKELLLVYKKELKELSDVMSEK
ncbi:hypothetical protein RE628_25410 [Paenibacillus sp. D2_2]|uniref:hypothetical protein n=1 Tax=Paenibacillus sp. D2_2 TaxID=3073092 RepID=UPI00281510AC|nr:hypothetical protein [Paenibacillus sp. D2_2]WMT40489.1 hypothetical protein RE628_25410 [Paenibacillus sp. D2_2]